MSLEVRNRIAPQMAEYDRIGDQWVPYMMWIDRAEHRSAVVSTDAHGFRRTIASDQKTPLEYDRFFSEKHQKPRALLVGSSSVFGVGAGSDHGTISSHLNRLSRYEWFNFGRRAINSTQELINLCLFLRPGVSRVIVCSGFNNLTLAGLSPESSPMYNSIFSQAAIQRAMSENAERQMGIRAAVRRLLFELRERFFPGSEASRTPARIDETRYQNILCCFERDLRAMKWLGVGQGFDLCFVLQPLATWIAKSLTPEEEKIFSLLDKMNKDWQILATFLGQFKERYSSDLARICSGLDIPFVDLNADARFTAADWLFVDRVHLTNQGYKLAAESIKREFEQ